MKRRIIWLVLAPLLVGLLGGVALLLIEYEIIASKDDSNQNQEPIIPDSAVMIKQSNVQVPANEYWHDTGIKVQKGDWLEFVAKGGWWNGISLTNPEGDKKSARSACGACTVPDGNLGELIGKVGDGFPFRIGKSVKQATNQDGNLFLAMNENTGPCKEGRIGSCYEDNNGTLEVKVTVRRIK